MKYVPKWFSGFLHMCWENGRALAYLESDAKTGPRRAIFYGAMCMQRRRVAMNIVDTRVRTMYKAPYSRISNKLRACSVLCSITPT